MNAPQIELGMNVWARDGLLVGRVARPNGSIVPPLPGARGEPDIVARAWHRNGSSGIVQVSRFLAPDRFVPFEDIAGVTDHGVSLAITERHARSRGWHNRPVLLERSGRESRARSSLICM